MQMYEFCQAMVLARLVPKSAAASSSNSLDEADEAGTNTRCIPYIHIPGLNDFAFTAINVTLPYFNVYTILLMLDDSIIMQMLAQYYR